MALSNVFSSSKTLPDNGLAKSVRESWERELLVDYTIQVDDKEFKVHKHIMAAVSDYFKAMLTGGMAESRADKVTLEGFSALAVQNIIEYIYTNQISGPEASAKEFLACAVYLQAPRAIEAGTKLLWSTLNTKNCWDIAATFNMYSLKEAEEHVKRYINCNFAEIQKTDIQCLPLERFQIVCEIWDGSELDLFAAIRKWVKRDYKKRKQHLKSLMSRVQFNIMTPTEIETVRSTDIYSDKSWHELVDDAEEYRNLPTHQKMLQTFKVRGDPCAVCFHTTDGIPVLFVMDENGFWEARDYSKVPNFKDGISTCVEFNNFLLVCESYSKNQKWHVFDARTQEWSKMAKMVTPKADFALVHDGKESVYALGGRVNVGTNRESVTHSIEKYNIKTNKWSVLDTTLPVPLQSPCACLYSGSIYVAGGWETTDKTSPCSTRLACFDTSQSPMVWHTKAPMDNYAPCHVMQHMEYRGEQVIVMLNDEFLLQFYKPHTDKWYCWQNITDHYTNFRFHPHSTVLARPSENALYLINFDGDCDCPCEFSEECMGACMRWTLFREDNSGLALNEADREEFPATLYESEWEQDLEKNWYICAMLAIPPETETEELLPDNRASGHGSGRGRGSGRGSGRGGSRRYKRRK